MRSWSHAWSFFSSCVPMKIWWCFQYEKRQAEPSITMEGVNNTLKAQCSWFLKCFVVRKRIYSMLSFHQENNIATVYPGLLFGYISLSIFCRMPLNMPRENLQLTRLHVHWPSLFLWICSMAHFSQAVETFVA